MYMLVAQSFQALYDPMDCSLPDSSIHWILWVRILGWVAIPFSRGSSRPGNHTWVSRIVVRFFTDWATRVCKRKFFFFLIFILYWSGFPGGSDGKESACNAGDPGSIPGSGRSPGEGNGYSSILVEELHGQKSLEGYSPRPRGRKEVDMTEWSTLSLFIVD